MTIKAVQYNTIPRFYINPPLNKKKIKKRVTFSVSSYLGGLLLGSTSWKVDKTLLRRVKSLFVGIKDKSQTNYGDIYNRIICCLGISGKQSEGGQREKKEKQMLLMLGTELCCALRSRKAYSVYCLQAGETPLSNHAGEEVHGRENRKRENALKCKQAHSHLLYPFPHAFICKQISDAKNTLLYKNQQSGHER